MMADHMPDYLTACAVLQRLAEQAGQGMSQQDATNGDYTINILPSPHVSLRRSRGSRVSSMEHTLSSGLATIASRAFADEVSAA